MARLFTAATLAVAAFALAVLAGCYRGPGSDDPTQLSGSPLPLGVATPHPGQPDPGGVQGVWPSADLDSADCCWLGSQASLPVRVPAHATTLTFWTFVPNLAPFRVRPQSLRVSVDGGPATAFDDLGIGRHELRVHVRPSSSARFVRVRLVAGFTFVPIKYGITRDGRSLSIYLRMIEVG